MMGTVAGMEVSIFIGLTVAMLHINISSEYLYPRGIMGSRLH